MAEAKDEAGAVDMGKCPHCKLPFGFGGNCCRNYPDSGRTAGCFMRSELLLMRRIRDTEAKFLHLEEAAELLLRRPTSSDGVPGLYDWMQDVEAWKKRDQALSAPTAESAHTAAKSSPSDDNSPGLAALVGAAQEAGRIPGPVLGTYSCPRCGLATPHRHDEPAPTAESGKDFVGDGGLMPGDQWRDAIERAIGVEPDPINHTPAWAYERVLAKREIGNGVRDESGPIEPAPVAEAPERVTADHIGAVGGDDEGYDMTGANGGPYHRDVRGFVEAHSTRLGAVAVASILNYVSRFEQCERAIASFMRQQEQSEREVAELRTQLTDANLKAEGLREDNEELAELMAKEHARAVSVAAKLAESERKLADARKAASDVAAQRNTYQCQLLELQEEHSLPRMLRSSTETAGVEAGKVERVAPELLEQATIHDNPHRNKAEPADPTPTEPEAQPTWYVVEDDGSYNECATVDEACELLDCANEDAYITTRKPEMPAPAETEAPARFRVGQRVLVTDGDHGGAIGRIVDIEFGRTWPYGVKFSNGYLRRFNAESLEPADPAPPKPGADQLTKLVAALQAIRGNYGGATHCFANDLIRELEREGGGK